MPQDDEADGEPNKADKNNKGTKERNAGLWLIVLTGGIILAVLLFVSVYLPNMTERVKFFTVNALSISILAAIAVQAFIYLKQQEIMRGQLDVMKASIRQTKRFFDLTERPSLGIEGEMEFSQEPNGERYIEVIIKNSGKSPAVQVRSGITTGIQIPDTYVPIDRCPEPAKGEMMGMESRGVIAISGSTYLSSKNLTIEEFEGVIKGELQYFIWIYVTYLKNSRQRKPYIFESYSRYKAENGIFVVCPTHNDAT